MNPRACVRTLLTATVLTALTALTGCTSGSAADGTADRESGNDVTVLQPAGPGEGAETLSTDASVPGSGHNEADVEFVQMMIPHHAQAVRMGELARTRAKDAQVTALAARIADAQGAEILELSAWLERHGVDAPTADELEHGAQQRDDHEAMMPGMLSEAEMQKLASASGHHFDLLYLRGMIAHHQGAVDMAAEAMDHGRNTRVSEIAADVSAGQAAEIARMRKLLDRLGGA